MVVATDTSVEVGQYAEHILEVPAVRPWHTPALTNVQLQLVASG
ncbi:glucosamine/fructose-6-phosphate aminotransferase [Natrinema versiforme JCM 10478]|uniref:Glucosamine/fructose-6-phosphate aminotransferase n=1 Tax=Natrinema versiforme JCM 10478 TaxID=1227496 RepID=L9XQ15_9EURY|nr:glucosamine/fructose-6-phosphate aminotransferase [Natrinema versiforme JCM 10478]